MEFKGVYSHEDVLKWFETIDIYVHPSHSEGLPRTILEAMTKATPCVCTKVGGVPELIDKEYLFSYDGREVDALTNIILEFNKDRMKSQAKINFERTKEYEPVSLESRRNYFFTEAINEFRQ